MNTSIHNSELDEIDYRLLRLLTRNGRATWADLAHELGLTAPAIAQRVRRLEERGVIRQFTAVVDAVGLVPIGAFVIVRLNPTALRDAFRSAMVEMEAVQECHLLAGDDAYLLKARFRSLDDLHRFVDVTLPSMPGVANTRTSVVLTTVKESTDLPLPTAA